MTRWCSKRPIQIKASLSLAILPGLLLHFVLVSTSGVKTQKVVIRSFTASRGLFFYNTKTDIQLSNLNVFKLGDYTPKQHKMIHREPNLMATPYLLGKAADFLTRPPPKGVALPGALAVSRRAINSLHVESRFRSVGMPLRSNSKLPPLPAIKSKMSNYRGKQNA